MIFKTKQVWSLKIKKISLQNYVLTEIAWKIAGNNIMGWITFREPQKLEQLQSSKDINQIKV